MMSLVRGACAASVLILATGTGTPINAGCAVNSGQDSQRFVRHLDAACTVQEREARAVKAEELIEALRNGRDIDVVGAVITGAFRWDRLPAVPVPSGISERLRNRLAQEKLTTIRHVRGAISIRDSRIRGPITTEAKSGFLALAGAVHMTGTMFEETADFSRTAFLGPVNFSGAVFLREALFIQALFEQSVRFDKTAFGIHTRFHRAVFADQATFVRAGFNGLAEFLEVTFLKDASFSRGYFKQGTGFSGSRFAGQADFSESLFDGDAYFLFTAFEGAAYFRRATFRRVVDFSDARLTGTQDFSKTFFEQPPHLERTRMTGDPPKGGLQDARVLYLIAAALFAFTLVFVFILSKR